MKNLKFGILIAATALFSTTKIQAQGNAEKGMEIAKLADEANNGWKNSSNVLEMTLKNRNGQVTNRKMHGINMETEADGDMSLIVFDTPTDVQGTASMTYTHKVGNDDQWLYLPALKRVKRISSSNKSGPFMGSEFAFEDLSSLELEKYEYSFIGEEQVNNVKCFKVESFPVSTNSGYKKIITWYNSDNYRTEKQEFYDRKDAKLKTLSFSDYKIYLSKFWRAGKMEMVNHQNGKETTLKFVNYQFNQPSITEDSFSQNSLKRAK